MAPDRSRPVPPSAPPVSGSDHLLDEMPFTHALVGYPEGGLRGGVAVEAWLIEAMFVLVFIRTLGAYLARRDPLQRDVMLVFSAIAVLFVTALVRKFVPSAPVLFDTLASALVLAQPLLTLRLVGRLRRVPRWLMACAFV